MSVGNAIKGFNAQIRSEPSGSYHLSSVGVLETKYLMVHYIQIIIISRDSCVKGLISSWWHCWEVTGSWGFKHHQWINQPVLKSYISGHWDRGAGWRKLVTKVCNVLSLAFGLLTFWLPWGEQCLLLHSPSVDMPGSTSGTQQGSQPHVDWKFYICEPKEIPPPLNGSPQVLTIATQSWLGSREEVDLFGHGGQ